MKKSWIIGIVIGLVVLLLFLGLGGTYNSLVRLDENVDANWAQVENQLKRRADLLPNLVNTVKGYASHESEVLLGITEARSGIQKAGTPGEYAQAEAQLTSALQRLNIVVENYPDLKANQNFIRLQDELAGTENRIAVARRDYNESARELNTRVRRFPTNIFANMFGFEEREYFEVSESDQELPEVNFE